jgi:hypothetical protein
MSASPVAATKPSVPPPATNGAQPPADAAAPPPRPFRPLAVSQIQLAEYATRHHVVTLSLTQEFEDTLNPAFWANVTDRMRVCDKIDIFDAKGSIYAELLVRAVAQSRPIHGTKGGARVQILRHVELEPLERRVRPVEYKVEFRGPAELWCVVRISDGAVMKSHLDSREMAERHLAAMQMAMA